MATALVVPYPNFVNGQPGVASQLDADFDAIKDWLNLNATILDSTRVFTGIPSTAVAPTTANHLVNKTYYDGSQAAVLPFAAGVAQGRLKATRTLTVPAGTLDPVAGWVISEQVGVTADGPKQFFSMTGLTSQWAVSVTCVNTANAATSAVQLLSNSTAPASFISQTVSAQNVSFMTGWVLVGGASGLGSINVKINNTDASLTGTYSLTLAITQISD